MDSSNWWEAQAQPQIQIPGQVMSSEASVAPGMEAADWRTQLQFDSRQRIVTKIMETLKKHLPFSGQEGLQELKKIAVRFEEKIYTAATSQSDYLRKISLKLLTMETKSHNPIANYLQPNAADSSEIPQIQTSDPLRQPHTTINQQLLSQRAIPVVPLTSVAVAPGIEAVDWRAQLQVESRQRIVTKIMETLKKHLPFSGQEGLQELKEIAVRFEEKIYTAATSQSDYLRKISLKMLTMETKSLNPIAYSLQPNAADSSESPQIQASDPLHEPHTTINQQLLYQRAIPEVPLGRSSTLIDVQQFLEENKLLWQ